MKLVIPFIRVGHLPRGPYIKVKGDLIMISSELKESLNKILPLSQDLIGVAFRRKISYRGHYIEEYVDKNKIHAYFNFFKDYNHLFQDFTFDDTIVKLKVPLQVPLKVKVKVKVKVRTWSGHGQVRSDQVRL